MEKAKYTRLLHIIIGILLVIIIIGVFFLGFMFGKSGYFGQCSEIFEERGDFRGSGNPPIMGLLGEGPVRGQFAARGVVVSVSERRLVIETDQGERSAVIDNNTQVRVGRNEGTRESVKKGSKIAILGRPADSGEIVAKMIVVER